MLDASSVLVTIGTPCAMSGVGSTETHRALVTRDPAVLGFAALDAGLVDIDLAASTAARPCFVHRGGERAGQPASLGDIAALWGARLGGAMGIRQVDRARIAAHVQSDIAAPLPHDLEDGGLRRLAGLGFADIRGSTLKDMFGLFDDDPRLAPSLQAQLFMYAGLGALAALPRPLHELLSLPHRFRIAAGTAFSGLDAVAAMQLGMQPRRELVADKVSDKFAFRLSSELSSHGPGLVNAMLSPGFNLSRVMRNPALLQQLEQTGTVMRRVPQAPLVASAACASASVVLCEVAPQMVLDYPGHVRPQLVLWMAADAAMRPDFAILEGFGSGAMMTRDKLDQLNAGRGPGAVRSVSDCLAPFDIDAQGTVVGHAGSAVLVTTLQFALDNFLDITSIIAGWGQSGETGGKGHFAGVGFGGENAIISALEMARLGHGYGIGDFAHLVAHATGTRTNSRTDLGTVFAARRATAAAQGFTGELPRMTVGAPKAVGDGHSMGETGLKATGEGIHYVLGDLTVGVPTLRNRDPELGAAGDAFELGAAPIRGSGDGGALVPTQGFGGYVGALALRSAHADSLRRYGMTDRRSLDAYLERWPELRRERIEREARWRRTTGAARMLAEHHRWPGAD